MGYRRVVRPEQQRHPEHAKALETGSSGAPTICTLKDTISMELFSSFMTHELSDDFSTHPDVSNQFNWVQRRPTFDMKKVRTNERTKERKQTYLK